MRRIVRGICDEVEGTLFAGDPGLHTELCGNSVHPHLRLLPRLSERRMATDILTEDSNAKARWSEYFEELLNAETPTRSSKRRM